MARKKDTPQKAALREMMGNYLKENNVKVKDGTDVNSIMRDMMSIILEGALDQELDEELGYSKDNWANLSTYFKYPEAVRRLIYTTNTIEGFNRQLRKVTKSKTVFPSDDSLLDMPGNCIIIQTRTESPKRAPSSITNDISYISFFCLHKT